MTDKVYELPDLPPAPYSDLQGLVRTLIEYADLSTLPAIDDELVALGRALQREWFLREFAEVARRSCGDQSRLGRWIWLAERLMDIFWHDLFGWASTIQAIQPQIRREDELYEAQFPVPFDAPVRAFRVAEDLTAGEWVVQDYNAVTLRRATPEEIPAPAPVGPTEEPAP